MTGGCGIVTRPPIATLAAIAAAALLAAGAVGVALASRPAEQAVAALFATGLVAAGVGFALAARRAAAGRPRRLALAVLSLAAGGLALAAPATALPMFAAFIAAALAAAGIRRALMAWGGGDPRTPLLRAATLVLVAALALMWPRLAIVLLLGVLAYRAARWGLRPAAASGAASPRAGLARPAAALAAALVLVVATGVVLAGAPKRDPDAFYDPPAGVAQPPGTLIRSAPFATGVPTGARALRILYWTADAGGAPAIASATVLFPATLPAGPRPVVAVAHGTTGVDRRCAPSLLDGPFSDGARDALFQMVARGWVAVTSDYVGLATAGVHPYLIGAGEAHDVLDAVRAAHHLDDVALDKRVVVWGHSQGGQAALWTGMVAPQYAPDLELLGVAALAPAADLSGLAAGVGDTLFGRIIFAYLTATWGRLFPGLGDLVAPGYEADVARIASLCFGGRDILGAMAVSSQVLGPAFRPDAGEKLAARLAAQSPRGPIAAPVLIAQGDADELVLVSRQRRYVDERCAGQAVDYREYAGKGHLPLVLGDSPLTGDLVAWTAERLAGLPARNTCPR
jgi:hypothetical protein